MSGWPLKPVLQQLLRDQVLPNHLPDVRWLLQALEATGPQGDPIMLSIGESWSGPPEPLVGALQNQPAFLHGYALSMYGLPELRQALRNWLQHGHSLEGFSAGSWEVAVTWSGTRSAMFDFGRLVKDRLGNDVIPVLITTAPGWDYPGVLEPLGFQTRYVTLSPSQGFQPDLEQFRMLVEATIKDPGYAPAIVAVNAQHNPTGVNWPPELVRGMIRIALEANAAILIDDAYFHMHDPDVIPTSAMYILLQELENRSTAQTGPWLAVHSLGKLFRCNGWGLGAVVSDPRTLDHLVNRYRVEHQYNYAGHLQSAMAAWLGNPASTTYLQNQQVTYAQKRQGVSSRLTADLGYPPDRVVKSVCAAYLLFEVPRIYHSPQGVPAFIHDCFQQTGVLLSDAWPLPRTETRVPPIPYVRMYLGPEAAVLDEALDRMASSGLRYQMAAWF